MLIPDRAINIHSSPRYIFCALNTDSKEQVFASYLFLSVPIIFVNHVKKVHQRIKVYLNNVIWSIRNYVMCRTFIRFARSCTHAHAHKDKKEIVYDTTFQCRFCDQRT
jgi:hypothetical protein